MDVHLVLKLMELVEEKGVYDGRALKHARVELLQKTQMADAAVALAEEIGEPVSAGAWAGCVCAGARGRRAEAREPVLFGS